MIRLILPPAPAFTRCPLWPDGSDGTPHTVIGCGATLADIRDDEGLIDCPACGMFFSPDREFGAVSA